MLPTIPYYHKNLLPQIQNSFQKICNPRRYFYGETRLPSIYNVPISHLKIYLTISPQFHAFCCITQ